MCTALGRDPQLSGDHQSHPSTPQTPPKTPHLPPTPKTGHCNQALRGSSAPAPQPAGIVFKLLIHDSTVSSLLLVLLVLLDSNQPAVNHVGGHHKDNTKLQIGKKYILWLDNEVLLGLPRSYDQGLKVSKTKFFLEVRDDRQGLQGREREECIQCRRSSSSVPLECSGLWTRRRYHYYIMTR